MKKRILAMIFVLALCFCTVIPAFAVDADGFVSEYERVQDMAKLLSESEREALIKTLDELSERQKMDVIVVTTNTLDGKKPMEYADDIYDYCKYGYGEKRDGLLFLVSMEDRDWWISTCGYGITAFTDAGIQYIGEQMVEDLGDGNYAAAFNTFAELSDDFITKSREGEPYDKSNLPKGPLSIVWIVISILVGIGLAMFIVGRMKAQLKTVRFQAAAGDYMKSGSLNITESRDTFLYNTVTRTAKPKNTDSGSSGGSKRGGSSASEDVYAGMYKAGIRSEGDAYAWLLSAGYNTTQAGKLAGYYADWMKNQGGSGDSGSDAQIGNRHGDSWIYIPGHGRFTYDEVENYVNSGKVIETYDSATNTYSPITTQKATTQKSTSANPVK